MPVQLKVNKIIIKTTCFVTEVVFIGPTNKLYDQALLYSMIP